MSLHLSRYLGFATYLHQYRTRIGWTHLSCFGYFVFTKFFFVLISSDHKWPMIYTKGNGSLCSIWYIHILAYCRLYPIKTHPTYFQIPITVVQYCSKRQKVNFIPWCWHNLTSFCKPIIRTQLLTYSTYTCKQLLFSTGGHLIRPVPSVENFFFNFSRKVVIYLWQLLINYNFC